MVKNLHYAIIFNALTICHQDDVRVCDGNVAMLALKLFLTLSRTFGCFYFSLSFWYLPWLVIVSFVSHFTQLTWSFICTNIFNLLLKTRFIHWKICYYCISFWFGIPLFQVILAQLLQLLVFFIKFSLTCSEHSSFTFVCHLLIAQFFRWLVIFQNQLMMMMSWWRWWPVN